MAERRAPVTAPELLLKIVLTGTQSHYESRGLIDDKRLEHLLHAGKQILYKSHQEADVRQNLGFSPGVWEGLTAVLDCAIPVLESQCFAWKSRSTDRASTGDGNGNDGGYDNAVSGLISPNPASNGSSSDLIAANYLSLVKDIERLNDLCTIARNLLATTRKAQNLAADKKFDQQILRLIDVCVRVTARGFDGVAVTAGMGSSTIAGGAVSGLEPNTHRNQDRWQKVVNLYKRLLITCLQFLHNFIMHNEHRKLVLWLDLFGNGGLAAQQAQQKEIQAVQEQIGREGRLSLSSEMEVEVEMEREDVFGDRRYGEDEDVEVDLEVETQDGKVDQLRISPGALKELQNITAGNLGYSIEDVHALFGLMSKERVLSPDSQDQKRVLMDKIRSDLEKLSGLSATQLDDNTEILLRAGAALKEHLMLQGFSARNAARPPAIPRRATSLLTSRGAPGDSLPELASYANLTMTEEEITEDDLVMPRTSESAAETLQEAKDELMARLQDNPPILEDDSAQAYEASQDGEGVLDEGILDSAEDSVEEDEEEEEEEEDDDNYRRSSDQERGLLTDVPLVLGPQEIEALPMIIQAGIVDNFGMKNNTVEKQGVRNMQAVRCHILLAQEAGRNVLRELLIFIAAWDLPDDEFYFKMMVQIMEAILKNGLMSHAYSDFGQAKDIISPAQAVVIKILTHIFRTKYSPNQTNQNNQNPDHRLPPKPRLPAQLSRVDVLTVRYIFTVFRGNIIPETCALIYLQGQIRANLAMAEDFPLNLWDMERVYEGVYQFLEFFAVLTENNDWKRLLIEWEIVYDLVTLIKELDQSVPKASLDNSLPPHGKAPPRNPQSFRGHASNTYAAQHGQLHNSTPYDQAGSQTGKVTHNPNEDPSDFEWRNLKKLIVLVLSSLVWKSPVVQDQIRLREGVPTILSCTQYDGHNPYIKEHAVMCLKFLLEGNKENQAIITDLEAQGVANRADLERDFGVRADVRNGRVRVEQQAPPQRQPGPRTYQQDPNYYLQQHTARYQEGMNAYRASQGQPPLSTPTSNGTGGVTSRPVRRASEGAASSTAEKLANMTERFNRLDISNFARGMPIRQGQQRGVALPQSHSIRDAHLELGEVFEDVEEDDGSEDEEDEDVDGDEGGRGRVMDVGEML